MSSGLLFGTNSIFAKIDTFTSFGLDRKLDDMLGLTPPETKGPRLSDLSVQTSTFGTHIPRLYGTISVMGNLLWLENGQLKESVRKKKKGGKGGGGASEPTTTYSYSATFHLALCEGPISGIRRMWCGDKLLYNAGSGDLETIIASNRAATGWRLYLGTDSQLPDSRYEANVGAGNATAHRGMAYIAFYDFQLADYSNTLQGAQFKVEAVRANGAEVITLLDIEPATTTAFGAGSVFFPTADMQRLELFDRATEADAGGVASFYTRTLNIGALSAISAPQVISGVAAGTKPAALKSNDNKRWVQHENSARNGFYLVSETGERITTWWPHAAQDITEVRRITLEDGAVQVSYVFTWGGAFGYLSTLSFARVVLGNTTPSPIETSIALAPDKWPSTAGDEPYNWGWAGAENSEKTISLEIYDVSISGVLTVVSAFSATLPNTWPVRGAGYRADLAPIVCRLHGRIAYLACRDRVNPSQYRYAAVSASGGLLFEYAIGSPYASTQGSLSAVWPNGENQGTIQTQGRVIHWARNNSGTVQVSSIISDEVEMTGLVTPTDIDVSLIPWPARGYRVSGGSIRSAIEPLQSAFPFDVRSHGYKLQFLPRGQAGVATIQWEELGAADGDKPGELLPQSVEMDTQLPARTTVKYLDAAREYAISEQYSERLNTETINRVDRELALVMTADEAAGAAEILQFLPWLERNDFGFTLPPPYRYLEAGDVVAIVTPTATHELRLTETNETPDGRLECKAKPSRAALYTSTATGAEGVPSTGTIGLAGDSLFVPLDIPVIDETLQNAPGFVGVMTGDTPNWPGGIAVRSSDGGQTWSDLQAYTGKASIGTARGTLPVSGCTLIDRRTLTVDLISGELDSVTRDQMLAGVNYAAYGRDGRWEIVRFQTATLQGDGSYLMSCFVRGEKGTEWATGQHVAGDYFVLLDDPDNAFIGSSVDSILAPRTYRAITVGGTLDEASDVPFTYRGVNLECLSPVYARGARDGSSNLSITFTRRSRLSSSWWATGVAAPLGETAEAYEIDVMSGATVKRTITSATPSATYSAANQAADFGSAQASITLRIYQLSAVVGRGYPLEVTL